MLRILLVLLLILSLLAAEKIDRYHIDISIEPSGELLIQSNADGRFSGGGKAVAVEAAAGSSCNLLMRLK